MTVLEILTPKMLDFIEQKLNGDYAYQLLKQGKKAAQVLRELENISVFIEFNEDQDTVWGEFNPHKKQITLNANMDLLYEPWGGSEL